LQPDTKMITPALHN